MATSKLFKVFSTTLPSYGKTFKIILLISFVFLFVAFLSFLYSVFNVPIGGDKRNRTAGLLLARQALSQLSYTPI